MQISALETTTIHSLNDYSQQTSKILSQALQFDIQWIPEQIIVNLAYQMHKTFLLFTIKRIISSKEI
jgi:hypothetical protein